MGLAFFLVIVSSGVFIAFCIATVIYVVFDIVRSDYDDKK